MTQISSGEQVVSKLAAQCASISKLPNDITKRAIFKPSIESSAGHDDFKVKVLRLEWANEFGRP
jgi:hypothetical protein